MSDAHSIDSFIYADFKAWAAATNILQNHFLSEVWLAFLPSKLVCSVVLAEPVRLQQHITALHGVLKGNHGVLKPGCRPATRCPKFK